ncbi:MAG: N-acetylneuraminate lyase [Clostridiales bacterium]|nr:N-acetylneuraminate lyase [Clostridiales bacterium]
MKEFKGILAALLTPYDACGNVNHKALKTQVRWLINQGIDGFYVCGSTGEAFLLSQDERKAILETVAEENNGEKLLISHVGQISTDHALDLGKHAKSVGVDAISSISPFYYKFSTEEIKQYYFDLMNGMEMPFFIYNFPAFSGFSLTPELLDEMCKCPWVAGVKFTASDFFQLERMKKSHPELSVWNGYDEMLLSGLSAGADGGIGSTYNVLCPAIHKIYDSYLEGDSKKALDYQHVANDMIAAICKFGVFPSIKAILGFEGMDFGCCRKPFAPLSEEGKAELKKSYVAYQKNLAQL